MTNKKTYEAIETSTGYTFIQAIDENEKQFAIPTDPDNTDYQAYLAWVAEGNKALASE